MVSIIVNINSVNIGRCTRNFHIIGKEDLNKLDWEYWASMHGSKLCVAFPILLRDAHFQLLEFFLAKDHGRGYGVPAIVRRLRFFQNTMFTRNEVIEYSAVDVDINI